MPNMHEPCSKETLLAILDDIRFHVERDDSFEGSVEYLMPFDEEMNEIEGADFVVRAAYRIGNLAGQGGMRIIGRMVPEMKVPSGSGEETEDG